MGLASWVGATVSFLAAIAVYKLLPPDPMATGAHEHDVPVPAEDDEDDEPVPAAAAIQPHGEALAEGALVEDSV
jgi:hypothetical protein